MESYKTLFLVGTISEAYWCSHAGEGICQVFQKGGIKDQGSERVGEGTLKHRVFIQTASHRQGACLNSAYDEPSLCSPRLQDTKTI